MHEFSLKRFDPSWTMVLCLDPGLSADAKATDLPGQTMHWMLRKTMPSSMSGALCFRQVQFISLEVPSSKLYLGHGFTGVAMVPRSNYSRALVSLCVGLAT